MPAKSLEKMYAGLRQTFRGSTPESSAWALNFGEEQLQRLVELAFERTHSMLVKNVLKTHYPAIESCRDVLSRLGARQARKAVSRRQLLSLQAARTRSARAVGRA